jgi:plastocyanin
MKRIISIAVLGAAGVLAFVACEGEPPKTPQVPIPSAAIAQEQEQAPEETTAPSASCTPPPPPCANAAALAAAPDAGEDGAVAAVAAVTPPPAPATVGSVGGTVVASPAAMTGFAVVYVDDVARDEVPHPAQVTISNIKMTFNPFVSVIPAGGKVVFRNDDPFPHNVFSPDHERFDMGMIPHAAARVRTFDKPGSYTLLCNLHPGMLGYVLVTPSNKFAKVDRKGHFSLKDLPNGTYKLTAWAPRTQPSSQSVTVKGGDVNVNFELHR